jgi:thymidylate synthase
VHIYSDHFDAVATQLAREPMPFPTIKLNPEIKNIDDFRFEDIVLENYESHPAIKAPITNVGGF